MKRLSAIIFLLLFLSLPLTTQANDVLHAVVQITNYVGNVQIMEIVDHTPEPEPEASEE